MLEKEADALIVEKIAKRKDVYCPLIKGPCQINCEAFCYPVLINFDYKMKDNTCYDVRGGYCTASSLHSCHGEP